MNAQELIDAGNDLSDRLTCPCGGVEDPTCLECLDAANRWERAVELFTQQLNNNET